MKVPNWFAIGCVVAGLNALLLFTSVFMRHATAQAQSPSTTNASDPLGKLDSENETDEQIVAPEEKGQIPLAELATPTISGNPSGESSLPLTELPAVPSLGESVVGSSPSMGGPNVLGPEDFLKVFQKENGSPNSPEALDLSQGYFEALKLRLETVGHLNQSAQGLVNEASILYQRGQIREARDLIGKATQLRELAAQLLVTRQ